MNFLRAVKPQVGNSNFFLPRDQEGILQYLLAMLRPLSQYPVLKRRVGFLAFLSIRYQEMCTHMDISVLFFNLLQCKMLRNKFLKYQQRALLLHQRSCITNTINNFLGRSWFLPVTSQIVGSRYRPKMLKSLWQVRSYFYVLRVTHHHLYHRIYLMLPKMLGVNDAS